jgi:hypothetical protein
VEDLAAGGEFVAGIPEPAVFLLTAFILPVEKAVE